MRFPECYKDMIASLWCFDNWTGKDAKIIDKCEFSSSQNIEMYRYEIEQSDAERYWIGSNEDKSEGCWPNFIGGSSTGASVLVQNMLDNVYMYVFDALELGPNYVQ